MKDVLITSSKGIVGVSSAWVSLSTLHYATALIGFFIAALTFISLVVDFCRKMKRNK